MTRWALRTHDNDGSEMWWGGTGRMWVRSPLEAEVFSDLLVETDLAQPMDRRACGPTSEWVDLDGTLPVSALDVPIAYRPRRSVYVAAALPQKAHASRFARQLEAAGVLVTSTWHETDATPQIEAAMPDEQRAEVAERCLQEVDAADTFVWLHGGASGRIGAIVEYGYALGRGKDVYLVPLDGLEIGSVFGAISPVAAPGDVVRALAEVAP